jgi:hypothetical protein
MSVSLDSDIATVLGRLRGQHDRMVHVLYLAGRNASLDILDTAHDEEMLYNLDAVDAITDHLERIS